MFANYYEFIKSDQESHVCQLLWSYRIWSGSPLFAHDCEVREYDLDLLCLPIIVKLQIWSGFTIIAHYWEFTDYNQDFFWLAIIVNLQNLIKISNICPLFWNY